jgi:hypothetical protein
MWRPLCIHKKLAFGFPTTDKDHCFLKVNYVHLVINNFNHSSGNLTAVRYQQVILEPFINQLHDDESALRYFQQDEATAHSARTTITMLREFFDNRLISRNTENIWPPRSCDLRPVDFFLALFKKFNLSNTCS